MVARILRKDQVSGGREQHRSDQGQVLRWSAPAHDHAGLYAVGDLAALCLEPSVIWLLSVDREERARRADDDTISCKGRTYQHKYLFNLGAIAYSTFFSFSLFRHSDSSRSSTTRFLMRSKRALTMA